MYESFIELLFSCIGFFALLIISIKRIINYAKFNVEIDAKIIDVQENSNNEAFPYKLIVAFQHAEKDSKIDIDCFLYKKPRIGAFIKAKISECEPNVVKYFGKNNWVFYLASILEILFLITFLYYIIRNTQLLFYQ